jgi:hypothetical protein
MLDPVSTWKDAFNALPKVADSSWASNMATSVDGLTTSKLSVPAAVPPGGICLFTFGKAAFEGVLLTLVPVPSAIVGATNFAGAWEAGVLASILAPPPNPGYPIKIPLAKAALILDLAAIVPGDSADAFASAFRAAFAMLET